MAERFFLPKDHFPIALFEDISHGTSLRFHLPDAHRAPFHPPKTNARYHLN
jgi:hypothetical protein